MENFHKHTSYSNIFIADSAASYEDYAKRALVLGQKTLSSVEHGWQSNYYVPYEVAKKNGLKLVFGAEAYFVKDRFEKDRTNSHIVILAKTEKGRRAINRILSDANETGYYYRPRVDLDLLMSLPPDDVFLTSACLAYWQYDDIEDITLQLHSYFKSNFMLEVQIHNTDKQRELNRRIIELSSKKGIELIAGLDSHYIYPEQAMERDYVLAAKNIRYEDEDGWFMDFPDEDEVVKRFKQQGVLDEVQVKRAMKNTDVTLDFEDFYFSDDIKLPTLYPGKTQEEKNQIYSKLVSKEFKKYMKNIPAEEYDRYYEGIKQEVQVIKNTGMADYFLIDYQIVKRAIELGGLITNSGRGSGVGYMTNTLLGFSKVDRFKAPIKLYPERFISESRILESHSLPDLDLNTGNPDIFAQAQEEILGKDHAYPMIAFGTFKKRSAFKLYAKAMDMDFDLANEISKQIERYDEAVKYADDDDERAELNIYDFVDEQYHDYIDKSKKYWGIIADKKKAPCSYLLYQGSIREEIGLIVCKSETTKKEYVTTVVDGAVAEKYKFLKNDLLTVTVVTLIDAVYKRIGIKPHTVNELLELVKNDPKVWDIYRKGLTMSVNQVEKQATTQKAMKYAPSNVSELSAFIAAIRPGFKSMYKVFENRESFSYGIATLDNILKTEELPIPFMIFQEQVMMVLNYAGFPLDECYSIIKDIAKKKSEKIYALKEQFIRMFSAQIVKDEEVSDDAAAEMSEKVWRIIEDNANYSFNSSHAYCMALDSLYCAWQKAYYPYEFYEVLMQTYSDKSKKDKVSELKQEMLRGFGITEGTYKWGADNRKFIADKKAKTIYPSLLSIKGLSQKCADDLYRLSQKKSFDNFYDLYKELKTVKSLNAGKITILAQIGYFDDFASISKIERFLDVVDKLYERSQFSIDGLDEEIADYVIKYSEKTEKQYRNFDYDIALYDVWKNMPNDDISLSVRLQYELKHLGYVKTVLPDIDPSYAFAQEYECKYKNPKITLYRISTGEIEIVKVKRAKYDSSPIIVGDIIKTLDCSNEGRWSKDKNDDWQQSKTEKELILKKWAMVR